MIKGSPPFLVDFDLKGRSAATEFRNVSLSLSDIVKYRKDASHGEAIYIHDLTITHLPSEKKSLIYGLRVVFSSAFTQDTMVDFNLLRIKDQLGDDAIISSSTALSLATCPKIFWSSVPGTDGADKCLDEQIDALVQVEGIIPLSILYVIQSGRNERIETAQYPVVHDPDTPQVISWGKISISAPVDVADSIVFKLLRITDGLNNSVQFPLTVNTLLPPIDSKATNKLQEATDEMMFVVRGHSHPSAYFSSSCQDAKIRTFYDSQTQRAPQVSISVTLEGQAPFELEYEFRPDSDSPPQPFTLKGIENQHADLVAYGITYDFILEPGQFRLIGVKDKFCTGTVKSSSPCVIEPVLPPSFSFSTSPIEETCFGAVGSNVDLSFSGDAPYWIDYIVSKREFGSEREYVVQRERETFQKHRSLLVLKPQEPGYYRYQFERVGDKNYHDGIPVYDSSLTQIIHPHSSAHFVLSDQRAPYRFTKCKGDGLRLDVAVQGSGPWSVVYEVVQAKKATRHSVEVDSVSRGFPIVIDNLDQAGIYTIDLVEIMDGNGCNVRLSTDQVAIEVLQSRPSVSFSSSKPVLVLEGGRAALPISLSGRGPFEVEVKHADKINRFAVHGSSRFIDVFGDGAYELVGVSDSICQGSVEKGKDQILVKSVAKPFMQLEDINQELIKYDVCQGGQDSFQIELHGKAPFKVSYTKAINQLDDDSGTVDLSEHSEVIDTFFIRLAVDSSKPGLHTYTFHSIADDNYKNRLKLDSPLIITQRVHELPLAKFVEPEQRVFHCTSRSTVPYKLQLQLIGKAPFNVSLEQKRDNQRVQSSLYENIGLDKLQKSGNGYLWSPETTDIQGMGKHEFVLQSIVDASGCVFNYDPSEPVSTFFEIADQAKITTFNAPQVCIGDLLSYSLQGTPPFTIGYIWKGEAQPDIIVADPMLSFWVGGEGVLTITKVCNSADCCDENVSSDLSLTTKVNSLPKAIVGSGDDSFDDIREGDESSFTVDFVGQPPFSFTYTRSRPSGASSALKEELFTVSGYQSTHVG